MTVQNVQLGRVTKFWWGLEIPRSARELRAKTVEYPRKKIPSLHNGK